MNYSFMTFSCPDASLDEILALAKRYDYTGVEPRAGQAHRHSIELAASPEVRKTIRQNAEDSGIVLCCLATGCRYADPRSARENVEETLRYLDLAADVGIPRLRVFGGAFPEDLGREAATDSLVSSLKAVADHARERGITVCFETHDAWCDPAHVAVVMQQVDHPTVAVNWDVMHPVRWAGVTMEEAYWALKPWIRHVHVHDGCDRADKVQIVPMGSGDFDHRKVLELLLADHYDAFISGEWMQGSMSPEFFASHLEPELLMLKRYEHELI